MATRAHRWLVWLLLPTAVAAQTTPSTPVEVVAHGAGATIVDGWRAAAAVAGLHDTARLWGIELPATATACVGPVALVCYGDGPGGEPELSVGQWGADPTQQLLRLGGHNGQPAVGRWVLVRLPAAWCTFEHLRWEREVPIGTTAIGWCRLGAECRPQSLTPRSQVSANGVVEPACVQDAAAWLAFAAHHFAADVVLPDCDFAREVLLVLPAKRSPTHVMPAVGLVRAPSCTWIRLDEPLPAVADSVWVVAVPRVTGGLLLELAGDDHHTVQAIASFVVSAVGDEFALRAFVGVIPGQSPRCERITSLHDWSRLRRELGGDTMVLADDWCEFENDAVLAIVLPAAPFRVAARLEIGTEEGVDVMTITTRNTARIEVAKSACLLFAVARRAAQTAVVLRGPVGAEAPAAAASEQTLRVFAGF